MKVSRTSIFKNIYFCVLSVVIIVAVFFIFVELYGKKWDRTYVFYDQTYNTETDRVESLVGQDRPSAVLVFKPNGHYYFQRLKGSIEFSKFDPQETGIYFVKEDSEAVTGELTFYTSNKLKRTKLFYSIDEPPAYDLTKPMPKRGIFLWQDKDQKFLAKLSQGSADQNVFGKKLVPQTRYRLMGLTANGRPL